MLIHKTFAVILMIATSTGNLFAQQTLSSTFKSSEITPELRKNAVDLLRETIKEIPNLKTVENRHFFTIESARLIWKYDEKESRRLIAEVLREFNRSHRAIAARVKQADVPLGDPPYGPRTNSKPLSLEQLQIRADFRQSARTRETLLLLLIFADPEMAARFVDENSDLDSLPGDQGYYSSVKPRIVQALLERNNVERALAIAREMLGREFFAASLDVLRRVYQKDQVRGRGLAEETLRKVISAQADYKVSTYQLYKFFEQAADSVWNNSDGMLSEKSLKDLAGLLGRAALTKYDIDNAWTLEQIARVIQKYAPQQALQIRRALKTKPASIVNANATNNALGEYRSWTNTYPTYPANYAMNNAANRMPTTWIGSNRVGYANTTVNVVNAAANAAQAAVNAAGRAANRPARRPVKIAAPVVPPKTDWEIRQERKAYLLETLKNGDFTGAEKKKIIEDLKDLVYAENSYAFYHSDGYISIIETLSRFAMASSDREIARGLMSEAEIYVRPQPRTYNDYVSKLFLAMGYSSTDPEKSFAIMESLSGINEVLENMMKFAEFADETGEFIIGREINARFMLQDRGLFRNLLQRSDFWLFLQNLAEADFQRTKGLAGKFEKNEFKMAARLLLLESLLGEPKGDLYF